ncbi:hypothetical protein [Ralstonia solanacearum]|uniref:hypothetical protein n=1 Tax=Ralstonia solanacearum TaxID=305 RepID=UPI0018D045F8|nr:hypothetical protein [Ralstonia solanacearum]
MSTAKFSLSSDGEMISPAIHDANLRGIVLVDPDALYIPLRLVSGASVCIVLRGVIRLRADDFRQGNIVLDITVSGIDVKARDLMYVYGIAQEAKAEMSFLVAAEKDFCDGKLKLVEINASYGCSLACVCRDIDVIEGWTMS